MAIVGFIGTRPATTRECLNTLRIMATKEKARFTERSVRETLALQAGIEAMETYHHNCTDRQIRQLDYLARNPAAVLILEPGIKAAMDAAVSNLERWIYSEGLK